MIEALIIVLANMVGMLCLAVAVGLPPSSPARVRFARFLCLMVVNQAAFVIMCATWS